MHHHIRQQYLHVELNGTESDGLTLQRRLPDLCRDWLMPALERTLDRYAPTEGTLCIERLEIDAGAISLDRLEHDLAESVSQALEKALREQIPSNEHVAEEYDSGRVSHKTTQHSIEEALVFFLETGQLPWSFRLQEGRNLEQAVLAIWEQTGQSGSDIQGTADTLRRVLRTESARKRLTRQFTTKFLTTLLTRLAPAGVAAMDDVFQVLNSSNLKPEERRSLERLLWENTLIRLAALQPVTAEAIVHDVLPTASSEYRAAVEMLVRHWVSDAENQSSHPESGAERIREGKQDEMKAPDAESRREPETEPSVAAQQRSDKTGQPSDLPETFGRPPAREEDAPAEERATGKTPADADNTPLMPDSGVDQEGSAVQLSTSPPSPGHPAAREEDSPAEERATGKTPADADNTPLMLDSGVAQEGAGEAVQLSASPPSSGHPSVRPEERANEKGVTEKTLTDTDNAEIMQDWGDSAQEQSAEAFPSSPVASSEQMFAGRDRADIIAEGIYINNAGLVLLHPFLPQFFGALGIAGEEQLLRPERALCLLHFLATGQPVAPEYELMLPKVLCNIPLDMPVEADVDLTDEEQDEADALLKAVIDHWEVLRNTSPDGLRGTFLIRPGKISLRGEDLLLQVEPQTWDIMLDQLPWGISMIKLPWMDRMLWVEWV